MSSQNRLQAVEVPDCVHLLGVPVHIIDTPEVIRLMEYWVDQRAGSRWIAHTNSHGIIEGHKHPEFKAVLKSADLSLPDGKWTARLAGRQAGDVARHIRGADLLVSFCELSSRKGYRNFFLGDTEEVLGLLTKRLLEQFPALKIAGRYSPPFRPLAPEEDARLTDLINQARADVLWVGLGLPKQEEWIFRHRDELNVPVMVAVGAAFKIVSGKVKSAPPWVTECGLEWMWRFAQEPRKVWRRVMVYGPQFVALTLLELAGVRNYE